MPLDYLNIQNVEGVWFIGNRALRPPRRFG